MLKGGLCTREAGSVTPNLARIVGSLVRRGGVSLERILCPVGLHSSPNRSEIH